MGSRGVLALGAVVICLLASTATGARAAQASYPADADTYVDATTPHRAYGHRSMLRVSGSPVRRAFLRFRVPTIRSARVTLRLRDDPGSAGRVRVRRVARGAAWSERRTTYARAPRTTGRSVRSGPLRRRRLDVDVTSLAGRGGRVDLAVSSARHARFGTRERGRPALLVVAPTARPSAPASAGPRLAPPAPPAAPAAPAAAPVTAPAASPPAPPPSDPVIAAAGDIACSPDNPNFLGGAGTATACAQRRTSDLLVGRPLSALLALGDLQYDVGTLSEFQGSFAPTWGRLDRILHPAAGNHEYQTAGAAGYFDFFNGVGNATGPAGARGEGFYSFDVGAWHLIALNSNCTDVACDAGSPQERWLRADLASHPVACTLAFWHHPRWSSGFHGNNPDTSALWNDLDAAGAEIVLSGHDHLYERFAPQTPSGRPDPAQGLREFIVGTGGADHHRLGVVQPNSEVRENATFGVLLLTLHPSGYDWRFLPEPGGAFTDQGTTACHDPSTA
jgi:acid phosphatase type 7